MGTVTIRDVAKKAGVGIASVSDILSGAMRRNYKPDIVARIRHAARELSYRPHSMASALRRQESTLVGIAVSDRLPPIMTSLIGHLRTAAINEGYHPVFLEALAEESGALPGRNLLAGIFSADLALESGIPTAYGVLQKEVPVIALYPNPCRTIDCITTDRARAIGMSVEHLFGLGHRRIAYAEVMAKDNAVIEPKIRGWNEAKLTHGIDPDGRYSIAIPDSVSSIPERAAAVVAVLTQMEAPPTALVCGSDDVALAVIGRLSGLGWRIPENLSVVGFDGVFYGEYCWPPLTTIAQPIERIAQEAVTRLIGRIAAHRDGEIPTVETTLIEPVLRRRGSTCGIEAYKPLTH